MDGLLAAADALHAIVRGSFGPSGELALVFAPPDAPLLTGDGHAVLRARKQQLANAPATKEASAPFERVMLDAAEGVYREAGDGTTQFVLMLHSVLHQIARGGGGATGMAQRVSMARAFGTLRSQWGAKTLLSNEERALVEINQPIVLEPTTNGSVVLPTATQELIKHVLTTALTGVLGRRILHPIVALIVQWVFGSMRQTLHTDSKRHPMEFLYRHLQLYLNQAPRAIVHAVGSSFMPSHVVGTDTFLIRKSLIPSQLPSLLAGIKPLHFVCFTTSVDLTVGSNPITYNASGQFDTTHALDGLRLRVIEFLGDLRETHGVRLIISTEKIEDYVAAACNHLEIACVQYAEREDVEALCSITGIYALTSVVEAVEDDIHVGVCSHGATVVRHSQSPSLYLRGMRPNSPLEIKAIPQLVVYASSKAVFKQYYNAILKSLRVIRALFAERITLPSVRLCPGAGATELVIAKVLRRNEHQMRQTGHAVSSGEQAIRVLSAALSESVATLHANLTQGYGTSERSRANRLSHRVLLNEMSRFDVADDGKSHGYILDIDHTISTKLGSVQMPALIRGDPSVYHVVHPWHRIETIIGAVLHTVERLLRVDAIVYVKRNPALQKTGLHEASEGDEDT